MPTSIHLSAYDADWSVRFIQEIEQWFRERYEREVVSLDADAATQPSIALALAPGKSAHSIYLPR